MYYNQIDQNQVKPSHTTSSLTLKRRRQNNSEEVYAQLSQKQFHMFPCERK